MPIDGQIGKEVVLYIDRYIHIICIHTHTLKYYSSIRKQRNPTNEHISTEKDTHSLIKQTNG